MSLKTKLNGKPLCVFDIEGTGTDVAKDRIVTLAATRIQPDDSLSRHWQIDPCRQMSEEVIAVHGITNEMARQWKPFENYADEIFQFMNNCDLAGFNLLNYDIPLLWEELNRCGIEWSLETIRIIDAGNIFKKKEERTLSAAVQFYLERNHDGAHEAQADVKATADVLDAQIDRYVDLRAMTLDELAAFSHFDDRIDLAGKIVKGKDGRPTYTIGKVRGVAVEDDLGFAYWMLDRDFPANTKAVLRGILKQAEQESVF